MKGSFREAAKRRRPAALAAGLHGGAKRSRTADLLNAIQALYQLSYSPELIRVRTGSELAPAAKRRNLVPPPRAIKGLEEQVSADPLLAFRPY